MHTELIMLLIAALAPFVTAVLAARSWTSGQKGGLTALLCLGVAVLTSWQVGDLGLVPVVTSYLAAMGAAQTAWLAQRPADLTQKLNESLAPDGVLRFPGG